MFMHLDPAVLFLDEWFVRRKGLAFGIMWAGTGASGVAIPFITRWLLDDYGHRTALQVWAVATVSCFLGFRRNRNGNNHLLLD